MTGAPERRMPDCCQAPAEGQGRAGEERLRCPRCGHAGQPVARSTVQALLRPAALGMVNGSAYRFCGTGDCPVVYYDGRGSQFRKEQIRVRVGLKETEDPIPVCYCFHVTARMIREEVQRQGWSSASARIRAEVKAGRCRCSVENPSGRCCLGEVIRAEQQAMTESKGPSSGVTAGSPTGTRKAAMAASSAGGLVAAFLASLCCIGPVVFAALGVGVGATGFLANTAGVLKALVPYRPLFLGLTALLLGVSFYLAYRKPRANGAVCKACIPAASGSRRNRWMLWIIAGLAVALALAPYWLQIVAGS